MFEPRSNSEIEDRQAELDEMRRLYDDEGMTLREIGYRFGVTRQAVHLRFVAAGIPRRSHYSQKFIDVNRDRLRRITRILDDRREEILRMYNDEKVPLSKIAKQIGVSNGAVRRYLISCGVEIRSNRSFRSFPLLGKLKIGESILLPRPTRRCSPHLTYYKMARTYEIRVSVRAVDERTFRVTRIQ